MQMVQSIQNTLQAKKRIWLKRKLKLLLQSVMISEMWLVLCSKLGIITRLMQEAGIFFFFQVII